jgi:hypothetical protein
MSPGFARSLCLGHKATRASHPLDGRLLCAAVSGARRRQTVRISLSDDDPVAKEFEKLVYDLRVALELRAARSHIVRAAFRLVNEAREEIVKTARSTCAQARLKNPPRGNEERVHVFEERLGELLRVGIRSHLLLRATANPQNPADLQSGAGGDPVAGS